MKKHAFPILFLFALAGCASVQRRTAVALLTPTSGSGASGTVTLHERYGSGLDVTVELTGVPPGVHGFHIHEKGDCGDNGNAAGAHFNPTVAPHGSPGMPPHHAGDWGNVAADGSGLVNTQFRTTFVTLDAGANSALGRAIILHASPDDLKTQPSGNAGARIACGVVQLKP